MSQEAWLLVFGIPLVVVTVVVESMKIRALIAKAVVDILESMDD